MLHIGAGVIIGSITAILTMGSLFIAIDLSQLIAAGILWLMIDALKRRTK